MDLVDVNGVKFTVEKSVLRKIPFFEALIARWNQGDKPIQLDMSVVKFFTIISPVLEQNSEIISLRDFYGINTVTRIDNGKVISEKTTYDLYVKISNKITKDDIESVYQEIEELPDSIKTGFLIEAVVQKNYTILDVFFVEFFSEVMKQDPYLFLTPQTYWIYGKYVSIFPTSVDMIYLNIDTRILVDIYTGRYKGCEVIHQLIRANADKLIIQEYQKLGFPLTYERVRYVGDDVPKFYIIDMIHNQEIDVVKEIISLGFDINRNVTFRGRKATVLHIAVLFHSVDVIKTLIGLGADIYAKYGKLNAIMLYINKVRDSKFKEGVKELLSSLTVPLDSVIIWDKLRIPTHHLQYLRDLSNPQ